MTTLSDYRDERLKKLEKIKELGIDPYPAKSSRDTKISDIIDNFDAMDGKEVTVAGRITAIRSFGKLAFLRIRDYSGEVQLFMKSDNATNGEGPSFEGGAEPGKASISAARPWRRAEPTRSEKEGVSSKPQRRREVEVA